MLDTISEGKPMFTFDEYTNMLTLQCSADDSGSELNSYLIDFHALSMSIEGWEVGTI
jgi:exocyst complex component 4